MANGRFRHRHDSGETVTHKVTAHRERSKALAADSVERQTKRTTCSSRLGSHALGIYPLGNHRPGMVSIKR
jgi:hypothetical protein